MTVFAGPDGARQLGRWCALAVKVEPRLMRALRLHCEPSLDVSAESALWWSGLVDSRSPDGFLLRPDVADELRTELRREHTAGSSMPTEARAIVAELHTHAPPAIRLEEEIAWAVVAQPEPEEAVDLLLRRALRALHDGRTGLAGWAWAALRRLPEAARATPTAWYLEQAAAPTFRRRGPRHTTPPPAIDVAALRMLLRDVPPVALSVIRDGDTVVLSDSRAADGPIVEVLDTDPRIVQLVLRGDSGKAGTQEIRVDRAGQVALGSLGTRFILRSPLGSSVVLDSSPETAPHYRETETPIQNQHRMFFVSYAGPDEAWARWVAEELEAAGVVARVQVWDAPAGSNFVWWIAEQMAAADQTIALCSPTYFESHWSTQEWTGALADRKVVPLRVAECQLPEVFNVFAYRDLFGTGEAVARRRLLEAVGLAAVERVSSGFPQASEPSARAPFPGRLPEVFEVPARNLRFTGRQELLDRVRLQLIEAGAVAVTALHGLGGVGKTQLAIEYAHRYASSYDVVWWVDAEPASLIGEQLAALAPRIGVPVSGRVDADAAAVLGWLRRESGWLVVFDNAEDPAALRPWVSDGPGHTLVTSRHPNWMLLGESVEVDVLSREESMELLHRRVPDIDPQVADALGEELGDLALALEQAAAYLGETRMAPTRYLETFRTRRMWMLDRGADMAYGGTVNTALSLALEQLSRSAPAAVQLLELCANLGPDPIPIDLFEDHPDALQPPLRDVIDGTDPHSDLGDTIAALLAYSLARRSDDTLQVHRLVAAVIRTQQPPNHAAATAAIVRELVAADQPDASPEDPVSWPRWSQLLPHILNAPAFDPNQLASNLDEETRHLLINAGRVLNRRGDPKTASALHAAVHTSLRNAIGDDHPDTLSAADHLAHDLRALGEIEGALEIDEHVLERRRLMLGEDHPDTLASANNLALDLHELGDVERAREIDEDVLAGLRRVLGEDHPDTLASANNLAWDLYQLGDWQQAREIDEDVLARRRRVLGEDHPETFISASNLAVALRSVGEVERAREIDEDVLTRRRRVLGEDHPETLISANNLALDLRDLGDVQMAREINEDVLARRRRVLGEDHPDTLASANNLASNLHELGQVERALEINEDLLERYRRVLGEDHPSTLASANNLAKNLRALGNTPAAERIEAEVENRHRRD